MVSEGMSSKRENTSSELGGKSAQQWNCVGLDAFKLNAYLSQVAIASQLKLRNHDFRGAASYDAGCQQEYETTV